EARRPLEIAEHDRDRAADLLSNGLRSERCPAHPAHAEAIGIFLPTVRTDLHSRSLPTRGRDPPPNVTGTCLPTRHDRTAAMETAGIEALPGRNRPPWGAAHRPAWTAAGWVSVATFVPVPVYSIVTVLVSSS